MSTNATSVPAPQHLDLLPQQIMTDARYHVRSWAEAEDTAQEEQRIEELAATIERDGQLDAGIVVPVGERKVDQFSTDEIGIENPEYVLIAGHRRKRAIALINEKRDANHQALMRMRVIVDSSSPDSMLLRKSIVSNIHRKDLSPMEKASLIQRIRSEYDWQGPKGTKKIAEYLAVNLLFVHNYERFLKADRQMQHDLHSGKVSAEIALMVLRDVKPEKQAEVLERAKENQANAPEPRTSSSSRADQSESNPERIRRPAAVKAIRDTEDSTVAPIQRNRKEILEFIESFDAPAYGYPDSAVRVWARYMIDKFATGSGTEKTARAKMDEVMLKSFKGTRQEETAPRAKGLRDKRRDAGVKRTTKPVTASAAEMITA